MTKFVCDKCGAESSGLHVLSLTYKGEPRIGGRSVTLDGRDCCVMLTTDKRGRREIDLCSNCVEEVVNAITPVISCGNNQAEK